MCAMGITGPNELEDAVYFDISMVDKRSKTCGHVSVREDIQSWIGNNTPGLY